MSDARQLENGVFRGLEAAGAFRALESYGAAAIVYTDSFDRADTTNTASSGTGLGAEWVGDAWYIASNQAARHNTGSTDWVTFQHDCGPDHWAEVVVNAGGTTYYAVLNVRRPADNSQDGYLLFLAPDGSGLTIGKTVSGGYSGVHTTAQAASAGGFKLRLEVEGATIRAYLNDTLMDTQTDGSPISGTGHGYTGMNANADVSNSLRVNNFRCGPLPYTP